jgi:ABC-2 type transport system permease protein
MTVGRIARRELLELWRDARAVTLTVVLALLLLSSVLAAWAQTRDFAAEQSVAQNETRRQWEHQGPKNPHSAAHFGTYAFKQPLPVAYLDRGVDAYLGVAVWVEAHKQNPFLYRPAQDQAATLRFGELTPALIIQELIPLLLFALTFSAFSGARESGLLRQELAAGVDGRALFAGKVLGLSAVLLPVLLPAVLAITGLVLLAPSDTRTDTVIRSALWLAAHATYLLTIVVLGLVVSAYTRSSRAALLVLGAIWCLGVVVAPRALADLGERLYPTPNGSDFWAAIQRDMSQGVDGHDPTAARTEALKQQVLTRYGVQRVEDLPVNFSGIALQAGEEYGNRVFDRHYSRLWEQIDRQNGLAAGSSLVTPLGALRPLSMALTGTDFAEHRRFAVAVESYRRTLNRQMNDALAYRSRGTDTYQGDARLWSATQDFRYAPADAAAVLRMQVLNIAVLLVWLVVVVAAAARAAATLRP